MDDNNQKPEAKRYIGKIKEFMGKYGVFTKIYIDNPNFTNEDGTENKYYKGNLVWIDGTTGKQYIVKQIQVKGVSEESKARGFVNSVMIDLEDDYCVNEVK